MSAFSPLPLAATMSFLNWLSPELQRLDVERATASAELAKLGVPETGVTVQEYGYQSPHSPVLPIAPAWVQIDLRRTHPVDAVALVPARSDWQSSGRNQHGFPVRFRVDLSDDPDFAHFTPLLDSTEKDFPSPGAAPVLISVSGRMGRYLRVTVTKMPHDGDFFFYALAEVMVLSGNLNVALNALVTASAKVSSPRWLPRNLVDGRTPLGPPIRHELVGASDGFYIRPEPGVLPVVELDLGQDYSLQQVRLHPVHLRREFSSAGFLFPESFRVEVARQADFSDRRVIAERENYSNPGNNPVVITGRWPPARYVRLVATKPSKGLFALSEIEVYADGVNVARGAKVTATPDFPRRPERWPESLLIDGYTSYGRLIELPEWLREWDQRRKLRMDLDRIAAREAVVVAEAQQRAVWLMTGTGLSVATAFVAYMIVTRRRRERELHELRARLARDFHDEIGSNLASITLLSEIAQEDGLAHGSASDDWSRVHRISQETTGAMHEMLWLIGGRAEVGADLEERLKLVASRMLPRCEVRWKIAITPLPADWPGESRREVFLFFKEALANVVRHSRAAQVDLSAEVVDGKLTLEIADNGIGFDLRQAGTGMGLSGLRKRARAVGGNVAIESAPSAGTRIRLDVPLFAPPRAPFVRRIFGRN